MDIDKCIVAHISFKRMQINAVTLNDLPVKVPLSKEIDVI